MARGFFSPQALSIFVRARGRLTDNAQNPFTDYLRMKSIYLIIASLVIYGRAALGGEIKEPKGALPLDSAIAEALAKNPELRVLEADMAAAHGELVTAKTWQNPELTVAPGVRRIEGEGAETEFHGEFSLSQLFLFPGKRALLVAIAERNVELRKLALEGLRFQLATAVRKAFYEQLAAQKIAALRTEQLASAETFQEAATKRVESGYASDFETAKSQSDVINAKKLLHAAEGQIAEASVELNTLMGRDPAAPLQVSGTLEGAAPSYTKTDLLALAMARNPSLRTRSMQGDIASLNLRKTRFGKRPDFAIGPSVEYLPSEQTYGISATISLPIWNTSKGEIESAAAEQRKALADIEKLGQEIAGAVTKSAAKLDVARDQLALYSPAYLDKLKALVAQAEKSYAQSATSLLIYLDARRTYFDTLADYYEALANVAGSRAGLESAIGVPLELKISTPKKTKK
jgi:cobalt-zinc-cadmium efflux system outer membrane protein